MSKKKYKWLEKLVDKITNKYAPLNNSFGYYGYNVLQTSGAEDYTSVTIETCDYDKVLEFSFDFYTRELVFESFSDYSIRNALVKAFVQIYGFIEVVDESMEEEEEMQSEIANDAETYTEEAVSEAKKVLKQLENCPTGGVGVTWYNEHGINIKMR